jgi:ketosteroid isomerase-like protein
MAFPGSKPCTSIDWALEGTLNDEQQIHALFDAGDRALMNADVTALSQVFGDDYVQYDPAGQSLSKQEILRSLASGQIRYPVIKSTARKIRLFGEMAIVHGVEEDEVEANGKRFPTRYLYMDVVCRRDGRWQIVGSQLVRPAQEEAR